MTMLKTVRRGPVRSSDSGSNEPNLLYYLGSVLKRKIAQWVLLLGQTV